MIDKDKKFAASITVPQPQAIEVKSTRGEALTITMRGSNTAAEVEAGLRGYIATLVAALDAP